jgi:putative hydrolases of HD superfamily
VFTKGKHPLDLIKNSKDLEPITRVYFEINYLKRLCRQGWRQRGISENKCESVSDHIFGTTMLAGLISDFYFPELDKNRIQRLALIHDVGEIYAGDITPYDNISPKEKAKNERIAIEKVFSGMPNRAQYLQLWEEYEHGSTPEAVLVKEVDKLEMALQAEIYYQEGLLTADQRNDFYRTALEKINIDALKNIVERLQ